MADNRLGELPWLIDTATGRPNGVRTDRGEEIGIVSQAPAGGLSASGASINFGSAGLSSVVYDGSNRVTSFVLGGVTYTLTGWGTSSVVIAGSDGSSRTMTLDGSGRISGLA